MSRKHKNRVVALLAGVAGGAFLIPAIASATMVGVQFATFGGSGNGNPGPSSPSSPSLFASQSAGLLDPANGFNFVQPNWNVRDITFGSASQGAGVNPIAVMDSTGSNPTGVSYSYTTGNASVPNSVGGAFSTQEASHSADSHGNFQSTLMGAFAVSSTGTTPSVFTFNHVPSGPSYDVIVYTENYNLSYTNIGLVAGSGTNPITGTNSVNVLEQAGMVNAADTAQTNGVFDGTTFLSAPVNASGAAPTSVSNYVVFTGVTPDINGNIGIDWAGTNFTSPAGFAAYQGIDAFQLVTVPEPATASLLIAPALMLLGKRSRKSR
jgi:hypothetical protein